MIKFIFTCFLIATFHVGNSQSIQGTVFNENHVPLAGVSVYFDGTTLGTTTNTEGFFELKALVIPNAILVISYIGYESIYLTNIQSSLDIQLKPSSISLTEVLLEPIPFTRKEMLQVFKKQFLGETKGGRACIILNEAAIQFSYDSKNFVLAAFSDEIIKIENPYLGYEVDFNLMEFSVSYSKRTLSEQFQKANFFSGTSFFQEISDSKSKIEKNREKAYLGSSKHFFKNLITKKWGENEFMLFEGSFATDPSLHFEVFPEGDLMLIKVIAPSIKVTTSVKLKFQKGFQLRYNNKEQSAVIFRTPSFYVDAYGNFTNIDEIDFSGEIAKRRIGDMLPANFEIIK